MSKSCSMQIAPNALKQPPAEKTVLQQQHGAIYTVRNNRRKTAYYGCCPVRVLLGIVILFQTSLIVIWMIREYFYFDFKCAVLRSSDGDDAAHKTVLIEEGEVGTPYVSDRRGIDSGWKEHTEFSGGRLEQSERFPRIQRIEYNPSLSAHLRSNFPDNDETGSAIHFPRPPRTGRSILPLSKLLYFPSLLAPAFSIDQSHRERKIRNGHAAWNRKRNLCFDLPGCLNLAPTQKEKNFRPTHKFIPHKPKMVLVESSIAASKTWHSDSGRSARRRRQASHGALSKRFMQKKAAAKNMRTKNPDKVALGRAGEKTDGKRKQEGVVRHFVRGSKKFRGRSKSSAHQDSSVRKYPSRINFTRRRKKGTAARKHIKRPGPPARVSSVPNNRASTELTRVGKRGKEAARKKAIRAGNTPASGLKLLRSKNNSTRFIRPRNGIDKIEKRNGDGGRAAMLRRSDSAAKNSRVTGRRNYLKWSGESWEADEPKPTQKRFHFLSGGSRLPGNKNASGTSWIDGVIDPHDALFSNKGQIRFYPGKVAHKLGKKRKKSRKRVKPISPRHSQERASEAEAEMPDKPEIAEKESDQKSKHVSASQPTEKLVNDGGKNEEFEKKQERKWKSAEDVQRRKMQRLNGPETEYIEEPASEGTERSKGPVTTGSTTVSTATAAGTQVTIPPRLQEFSVIEEPADQFRVVADIDQPYHTARLNTIPPSPATSPYTQSISYNEMNIEVENGFARGPKYYMSTLSTTLVPISTVETPEQRARKRELFLAQLTAFTTSALCITRSLLDCWCVAECAAAIPFLLGVWCPLRCLFAAHIILGTLFLVLGFIYSITIAVYSVILYLLVAEMGVYMLLQWLCFAIAVDLVLIIYLILFVITLRCCELVVGEPYRRHASASCATGSTEPSPYQEIGQPDGSLL